MNKIVTRIVSKHSSMLTVVGNGNEWNNRVQVVLYRALDEKGREVMFDIDKDKLIKRLNQSGYQVKCQ